MDIGQPLRRHHIDHPVVDDPDTAEPDRQPAEAEPEAEPVGELPQPPKTNVSTPCQQ